MLQAPGERSPGLPQSAGKRFLVMTESIAVYESVCRRSQRCFAGPVQINGEPVYSPAVLCGVIDAQTLRDGDALLAYVEYLTALAQRTPETILIQGDEETLKGFRYTQEIESFLETALEQDRFEVYYQRSIPCAKAAMSPWRPSAGCATHAGAGSARGVHRHRGEKRPDRPPGTAANAPGVPVPEGTSGTDGADPECEDQSVPTELMKSGHAGRLIGIIREFGLKPSIFNLRSPRPWQPSTAKA
ncbi:MAG: hypothetical protein ACLU9S_00270 [Oscillospiraceae bacterium]